MLHSYYFITNNEKNNPKSYFEKKFKAICTCMPTYKLITLAFNTSMYNKMIVSKLQKEIDRNHNFEINNPDPEKI